MRPMSRMFSLGGPRSWKSLNLPMASIDTDSRYHRVVRMSQLLTHSWVDVALRAGLLAAQKPRCRVFSRMGGHP